MREEFPKHGSGRVRKTEKTSCPNSVLGPSLWKAVVFKTSMLSGLIENNTVCECPSLLPDAPGRSVNGVAQSATATVSCDDHAPSAILFNHSIVQVPRQTITKRWSQKEQQAPDGREGGVVRGLNALGGVIKLLYQGGVDEESDKTLTNGLAFRRGDRAGQGPGWGVLGTRVHVGLSLYHHGTRLALINGPWRRHVGLSAVT
ncbi:hypothetical protein DPEC_G00344640 [Dallia pectoralis]|uniref:Uncharacterized protein n=1 Tax=Dallia pectoralis TaxID=75939 RepID=A0ACC2F3F9_DALPE|nr:hypothetical protein DPEC_G00344640 [Dallia pectoralis]